MLPEETNPRIDRVKYELRASGVKPDQRNPLRSGVHTRGYLPHVKREGASYFVTFRLADSLPQAVLVEIQAEHARQLTAFYTQQEQAKKTCTVGPKFNALEQIERDHFRKVEDYLDKGAGASWLRHPDIAGLVANAMRLFNGERYLLKAWVVMPNHAHAVLWPTPNHTLSKIMQSWKSFTGREANKLLGRTGQPFWQPEPFDHWIRNDAEHFRCCRYVVHNPVKARLCSAPENWQWSSAWNGQAS